MTISKALENSYVRIALLLFAASLVLLLGVESALAQFPGTPGGGGGSPTGGSSGGVTAVAPRVGSPPTDTGPIEDPQELIDLVAAIVKWLAIIFWIAAVGFIFYAAYIYLTAGGDPERIKKAHKQLLYAVIAIAVALMATGLPFFIDQVLKLR